jgi:site-specific recombinase XerD
MQHFRSKPLPDIAEKYLLELAASGRGKNTISLYRAALHHFYRFLLQQRLTLSQLSEAVFNEYNEDLIRHHLKLVTRKANIGQVHIYLRWLEARGELTR